MIIYECLSICVYVCVYILRMCLGWNLSASVGLYRLSMHLQRKSIDRSIDLRRLRDGEVENRNEWMSEWVNGWMLKVESTLSVTRRQMMRIGRRFDYVTFEWRHARHPNTIVNSLATHSSLARSGNLLLLSDSFRVNRRRRVRIDGFFSFWREVLSGLPQDSIWARLLFIVCINLSIT